MKAAFDHIAHHYDKEFTYSKVGALQRQKVWDYMDTVLPAHSVSILELNCGTGEDALYLAGKGHRITATDISQEMINVATVKATKMKLDYHISFLKCDLNKLEEAELKDHSFDFIFSNFGGLNCLDAIALQKVSKVASRLLKPEGHFIGVIMPAFCLWESGYFLGKLSGKNIFRRASKGPLKVIINDQAVETWYYSPKRIEKIFSTQFQLKDIKPVGFFLPPSYLQHFFSSRESFLKKLDHLENKMNKLKLASWCSDHFLIDLELKKNS